MNLFAKHTTHLMECITIPSNELKRLHFLENGVVNYSGGVFKIVERLNNINTQGMSPEAISLLDDLKCYFRDIIVCANLSGEVVHHE